MNEQKIVMKKVSDARASGFSALVFFFFFSVLVSRAEKQEPKVTDAFTGLSITLKTTSPQKSAIMLQALVAEK